MNNTDEASQTPDTIPIESIIALNAAANYLSKVPNASKRLQYVADTIVKYLKGGEPSLDHAFGFKKGRGQYKREDNEEHIKLVFKALKMMIFEDKPFKTISELSGYEEKEFRRLWARYKSQAIQMMADNIQIDFDAP